MKHLHQLANGLSSWLDRVAGAIVAVIAWFFPPRKFALIEGEAGVFTLRAAGKGALSESSASQLQIKDGILARPPSRDGVFSLKGCRVEIVLQPSRFMFRQIELPSRANEFLDGIIRAQIDRLTPWSSRDAAFGWARPAKIANDRIAVTIAATARTQVMPFVDAVTSLGSESVIVSTIPGAPELGGAGIEVLEHKGRTALNVRRTRRALVAALMLVGLMTGGSVIAAIVVSHDLQTGHDDISRRVAERRMALRAGLDAPGNAALDRLERRKHEVPSSVLVLEALSQVLPDHTYVTELRIDGNKMQVIGVTRDAPSLIGLIENSPHFTRATFFAPTTRSSSDPGERFHIEAHIEPVHRPRS